MFGNRRWNSASFILRLCLKYWSIFSVVRRWLVEYAIAVASCCFEFALRAVCFRPGRACNLRVLCFGPWSSCVQLARLEFQQIEYLTRYLRQSAPEVGTRSLGNLGWDLQGLVGSALHCSACTSTPKHSSLHDLRRPGVIQSEGTKILCPQISMNTFQLQQVLMTRA